MLATFTFLFHEKRISIIDSRSALNKICMRELPTLVAYEISKDELHTPHSTYGK
jgi:hypothetical protein